MPRGEKVSRRRDFLRQAALACFGTTHRVPWLCLVTVREHWEALDNCSIAEMISSEIDFANPAEKARRTRYRCKAVRSGISFCLSVGHENGS